MKNIWLLRPHKKIGQYIHKSLSKKYKVSLLTTNKFNLSKFKKKNKDSDYLINEEILNLNLVKDNYLKYNLPDDDNFKELYIAMQVLERNERKNKEISFEERNYLVFKQYNFWKSKIEKKKPNCVIFFDIPHMYYELVLLGLLKKKKVPIIILNIDYGFSFFLDGNFKPINLGKGKNFNQIKNDYLHSIFKNKKINHDVNLNKQNLIINDLFNLFLECLKIPFKILTKKNEVNSKYIKINYFKFGKNSNVNENITNILNQYKLIINKMYYNITSNLKIDLEKEKYIYFPLISHYENILHPLSSPQNLFLILENLISKLPNNLKILIKEHPRQFNFRHHQKYSRDINFYKKLKQLKNVELIDLKMNHRELIKKSSYVLCSSSSTSALESISEKRKFIYFGYKVFSRKYGYHLDDLLEINKNLNLKVSNETNKRYNFFYSQTLFSNKKTDELEDMHNDDLKDIATLLKDFLKKT